MPSESVAIDAIAAALRALQFAVTASIAAGHGLVLRGELLEAVDRTQLALDLAEGRA